MTLRARLDVCLAVLCCCWAAAAAAGTAEQVPATPALVEMAVGYADAPVVQFPGPGTNLKDLPGAAALNPRKRVTNLELSLVPAVVEGPTGSNGQLLRFANSFYRNDKTEETFMFGPTIRARAGDRLSVRLRNELVQPEHLAGYAHSDEENGFHGPMDTNLHTHGLHDAPGMQAQTVPVEYTGQDNIFVTIPAKPNISAEAQELDYVFNIPEDHLPGLHWAHPHKHGATMLQTITSSFAIVVEDDHDKWLPKDNGCGEIRVALSNAEDVLLHMELMAFGDPQPPPFPVPGQWATDLDDTNVQVYSALAAPTNPLCCGGTPGTRDENSLALSGNLSTSNFMLVNGGWQPVLDMSAGQWQRWRVLHAGVKTFVAMQIVQRNSTQPADCEMQLVAKDGAYMPLIPRKVDTIVLPSGARGELLVRCNKAGTYTVTAAPDPHPFGANFRHGFELRQPVMWTLNVAENKGKADAGLKEKACIPLRPSYAPDLRDAALAAAGAQDKLRSEYVSFVGGGPSNWTAPAFSCTVNGKNFSYPDPEPLLIPVGQVTEWKFMGLTGHPVHLHVAPFQVTNMSTAALKPNTTYTNWFEEGDFADTLMLPMVVATAPIGLRVQPGAMSGYSVMHCHLLNHEDMGCMKVVKFGCPGEADPQPLYCEVPNAVPATLRAAEPGKRDQQQGPTASPELAPGPAPSAASAASLHAAAVLLALLACLLA